jgi:hypothetical protein
MQMSVNQHIKPADILPPGPSTGYANPSCYLGITKNCCRSKSGEHYVSAAALSKVDRLIRLTGVPWIAEGETRDLPISALKTGILCKRHNEAFSQLDSLAGDFVEAILEFSIAASNPENRVVTFYGPDIERWMLKTLYGLMASKSLQDSPGSSLFFNITPQLVDLLYGRIPFEQKRGLFVRSDHPVRNIRHIQATPVINKEQKYLSGMSFNIGGFDFLLSTCPIDVEGGVFRPQKLIFDSNTGSKIIEFIWEERKYDAVILWQANHSNKASEMPA